MSYQHLSINELALLHRLGWSTRAIGKAIGRHHATVARELKQQESYATKGNVDSPKKHENALQLA